MTSIRRLILLSLVSMLCIQYNSCINFCDVKTFDTVFNIGRLIYFLRCGEMWTYDPSLNGWAGGMMRDISPLVVARKWSKDARKDINISYFSIQELNCISQVEDIDGRCKLSVRNWQHFTFLITNKKLYTFKYNTEYVPQNGLDSGTPLDFKFIENIAGKDMPDFFPALIDVAPKYVKFFTEQMEIKHLLFDSFRHILFLAIKHEQYYCVTYLKMEKMLFSVYEWPTRKGMEAIRMEWKKANCFAGSVHGMFFFKNQAYLVGRVENNAVFEDQVYRLYADGRSKVDLHILNMDIDEDTIVPQTVRTYFGCGAPKPKNILRKKRSIQEPIKTSGQRIKSLSKRVANNVLIQIMASVLAFTVVCKLAVPRHIDGLRNKVYNKLI